MRYLHIIIYTMIILFFVSPSIFSTSIINVPLNHWSYSFIERMQAKGILGEYISQTKPYSRGKMANMVLRISSLLERGKIGLTKTDKELLQCMKKEFAHELALSGIPDIAGNKHLIDWTDDEMSLVTEVSFTQNNHLDKYNPEGDRIYQSSINVDLYGDLWENLSFYNHSQASHYAGAQDPPAWKRSDPWYNFRYPWRALSDSYFVFGNSKINISAGKDAILWGPGYHGVIGLTSADRTFDIVKFHTNVWKLNFTSLLGFLRDDVIENNKSLVLRKNISAHRIEFTPYSGVCIAWQEAYVYDAKDLHIELLNPLMPYQMAEDYLGEIGNNTMEGDLVISLIPNTKIYSALFLDDFHPDKSPFKYPKFEWAILNGALITDPFGIDDTDFVVEYARVEPWTYTHKGTIQNPPIPTAFKNFDEPLGHWIGPNSDDLFIQAGWRITTNLRSAISYNRIRHGESGSNIYDAHRIGTDEEEKGFLKGIIENEKSIGVGLEYNNFHSMKVSANYKYKKTENKQKAEAQFPRGIKERQSWKSGWNTVVNEFDVKLSFKY